MFAYTDPVPGLRKDFAQACSIHRNFQRLLAIGRSSPTACEVSRGLSRQHPVMHDSKLEPSAPGRPSLREMYEDYLSQLPRYRGIPDLAGISCIRPFFGFVPNWNDTPLQPITSRLLHFGDSAGNRSALSFAGDDLFVPSKGCL